MDNLSPVETAHELLEPRWCYRATIQYEQDILFFKDITHKAEVLLYNIGEPIYAYFPRFGVWKTKVTMTMI